MLKKHALIIGLYTILALAMTWPVIISINSRVAGVGGDPWQTMWRFEYKWQSLSEAMQTGGVFEYYKSEFLGGGEGRLVNLSVWPWMWLYLIFGMPAAYNLVWLLSFVLGGYFMYCLADYLLVGRRDRAKVEVAVGRQKIMTSEAAAFIAGVAYMFLPYHVAHAYGHFGAMQVQWLPLALLAWLSLLNRPVWWKGLSAALATAAVAWSEHHYALWLALFVVMYIAMFFKELVKKWPVKKIMSVGAVTLAVIIGLIIIPYWPTISMSIADGSALNLGEEQKIRFSADLFAYFLPASFQTIWGGAARLMFNDRFTGNLPEATHFLGLIPILLVVFFCKDIERKQKNFWLAVTITFLVISLGPKLHVLGHALWPMPYALIDNWPVLSSVRTVARASVMVGLGWVVMMAFVLQRNIRRLGSAIILTLAILIEFLFLPFPTQSAGVPGFYDEIRGMPGSSIIEIPAATNYTIASKSLWGTLIHGKRVIGNIALERAQGSEVQVEVRSLPALRQLLYLRSGHILLNRDDFFKQDLRETLAEVVKYLDIGAVIVHADSVTPEQLEVIDGFLRGSMGWTGREVGEVMMYRVEDLEKIKPDNIFIARDAGWKNVGYDKKTGSVYAEVFSEAGLTVYNNSNKEEMVQLDYAVPEESRGELGAASEDTSFIKTEKTGRHRKVKVKARIGKTKIMFINKGEGKAIIKDPVMTLSSVKEQ